VNATKRLPCSCAVLLVFVSGCSGAGGSASDSVKEKSPSPETKQAELVFHATPTSYTESFFADNFGKFIVEKFPDVKVKFIPTTVAGSSVIGLKELLAQGQTIDVVIDSFGATALFDNALQYDLTPLIAAQKYDLSALEPNTMNIQKALGGKGAIYGLPFLTNTLVLNYNKDLFDKFGVPYLKDNSTWDDIYELARKMTRSDGGVNYRGFVSSYSHQFILSQLSVPFQDPATFKSLFETDKFKREMEFVARPYLIPGNGWDRNPGSSQLAQEFSGGKAAMYVGLDVAWSVFKFDQVNFEAIKLPSRSEAPDMGPQTYPWYMYVTNMSRNKDAAFQVAAYFSAKEYQTWSARQGNLPILKDSADIMKQYNDNMPGYKGKNKNILWSKLAPTAPTTPYNAIALKHVYNIFYAVIVGQKDLNTALREGAEAHDKEIAAALGK
jgi:multiple sugar transport system substrate-binding protein